MSAYIVSDETINIIVSHLYMDALGNQSISRFCKLKEMFNLSFEEDCIKLAEEMFALNVDAVEQRYGKGEAKTFRSLDFVFHFQPQTSLIHVIKALEEWHYQCMEGDVPTTKLYQAMEEVQNSLYVQVVHNSDEWKEAGANK